MRSQARLAWCHGAAVFVVCLAFLPQLSYCRVAFNPSNDVAIVTEGVKKIHFILDVTPIEVFKNISLNRCLELCLQYDCKSFNYGFRKCALLTTFYCESDITQRALKVQRGFAYVEVVKTTFKEDCTTQEDHVEAVRHETACVTDGRHGHAAKGVKCQFPFYYKGQKYDGCTNDGWDKKRTFWCSTDVTSHEFNPKKWGSCSPKCRKHPEEEKELALQMV